MSEIIKISSDVIGTRKVDSVNARDLYATLEITKAFSDWIKVQIQRAGLVVNVNYITFVERGDGRPSSEYILTAESAKHIAMMSQGKKAEAVRDYFIQAEEKYRELLLNPNIHELSGRVGGLTRSNNELRKELDKWKKKSKRRFENLEDDVDELKKRPIMITHKGLDEKLEILFRKSDILANEKTDCFWQEALQNHIRFYKEYVEILQKDGSIPQQWAINQVENEKKKRVEVEKELNIIKWRFDALLEKMTNLQNLAKNLVDFDIENERNFIKDDAY